MCPSLNLGNGSAPLNPQAGRVKELRKIRVLPEESMDKRSQNDRRLLYHLPASRNSLSCRGYRNIKVIDLVHY